MCVTVCVHGEGVQCVCTFLFSQKLKKWVVLKIYLPEEKLYNIGLELNKKKSIDDGTGCDCRFFIPQLSCNNTDTILDKGGVTKNIIIWHRLLEGDFVEVSPWLVGMVRPMGSQYLNAHNKPMSDVLSCNTNIQIGGRCQVFYSTLYVSKNNQKKTRRNSTNSTTLSTCVFCE